MTKDAGFKRRVRRRMVRTGEAYATARARLDRSAAGGATQRVLHVTNGDSVSGTLQESGVVGQGLSWRGGVCGGPGPGRPAPPGLPRGAAGAWGARLHVG